MSRNASFWVAWVAQGVLACGFDTGGLPEPPLPDNLESFDARAVERIQGGHRKVELDPARATAWAEFGMIYASERLKSLALECFEVAARLEPDQPKWPYRQAITLGQLGATEQAIAAIQRSLSMEPGYAPSHARLGNFRLELGELEGAEHAFREAVRIDSSYPGGWVGLARTAMQGDRLDEAIEILERLVREDPEELIFRLLLDTAQRQAGRTSSLGQVPAAGDESVPVWNDPWELEARAFRSTPTMVYVGDLLQNGRAEEALSILDEECARGADRERTAQQRIEAYIQLGRTSAALEELSALLAREPENTAALLSLARTKKDLGQPAEALAALERVTALQPNLGGAFAAKGRLLFELGQPEPAVPSLQRALELGVDDFGVRYLLGQGLLALRRWSEARALFSALVVERADLGDAWLDLAIAQQRTGHLRGALIALATAKEKGGLSPGLLQEVEQVLQARQERGTKAPAQGEPIEGQPK